MLELTVGKPLASKKGMMEFLDMVPKFPHIAFDTEGDFAFDPPLFLGFSLAWSKAGMYFPINHVNEPDANVDEEVFEYAMKQIELSPLRVFQHAGHDLMVMEDLGFKFWDLPFACTMIMAHMINENLPSKSLDNLHKHFTGGVGKIRHPLMQQIIDTLGWKAVPVMLMNEYGTQDAVATSELFIELEPRYVEQFGPLYAGTRYGISPSTVAV